MSKPSAREIALMVEGVRLGELMFLYKTTYGLPTPSIKEVIIKETSTEVYKNAFEKLVKFIEENYESIISEHNHAALAAGKPEMCL